MIQPSEVQIVKVQPLLGKYGGRMVIEGIAYDFRATPADISARDLPALPPPTAEQKVQLQVQLQRGRSDPDSLPTQMGRFVVELWLLATEPLSAREVQGYAMEYLGIPDPPGVPSDYAADAHRVFSRLWQRLLAGYLKGAGERDMSAEIDRHSSSRL